MQLCAPVAVLYSQSPKLTICRQMHNLAKKAYKILRCSTNAMSSLPPPTCDISLIIAQYPSNGSIKTQQVPRSHWVPLGSDQFVNSQGTISSKTTHCDIIVSLHVAQTWNPEKKCILHYYAVCALQWTVFIMYFALLFSWQSVCGANDLITTWSQTFHLGSRHLVN